MNKWLAIVRPINCVMGLIATWISGLIGVGTGVASYIIPLLFASVTVFMVTAGGNIINDLVDVESDRTNHPNRPLVKGTISVPQARSFATVLFALSLVISLLFISATALLVVALAEALLIGYEMSLKKQGFVGNVSISILVGLIFIFGGIAVNSTYRMIILFVMASLANLSREVIKDIEDMKGDVDRVTLPKKYGVRLSVAVAITSVGVAIGFSIIPYLTDIFSLPYLGAVAVADALFIVSAVKIGNPHFSQNMSKFAMIVGLISFTIGGLY